MISKTFWYIATTNDLSLNLAFLIILAMILALCLSSGHTDIQDFEHLVFVPLPHRGPYHTDNQSPPRRLLGFWEMHLSGSGPWGVSALGGGILSFCYSKKGQGVLSLFGIRSQRTRTYPYFVHISSTTSSVSAACSLWLLAHLDRGCSLWILSSVRPCRGQEHCSPRSLPDTAPPRSPGFLTFFYKERPRLVTPDLLIPLFKGSGTLQGFALAAATSASLHSLGGAQDALLLPHPGRGPWTRMWENTCFAC